VPHHIAQSGAAGRSGIGDVLALYNVVNRHRAQEEKQAMNEVVFSLCFTNSELPELEERNFFNEQINQIKQLSACRVQLCNLDGDTPFEKAPPVIKTPYVVVDGVSKGGTFHVLKGSFDELFDEMDKYLADAKEWSSRD